MKQFTLFRDGSLYKGNLHTHTTVSDGRYSPQETVERYKKNGYAFLGITDHAHYGYYPEFETAKKRAACNSAKTAGKT